MQSVMSGKPLSMRVSSGSAALRLPSGPGCPRRVEAEVLAWEDVSIRRVVSEERLPRPRCGP